MFRKLLKRTPLAWLEMSHQRTRLLVSIAGIAFADFLMFFQLGIRDSLYDSQITPYVNLKGDLFLVNRLTDNLQVVESFSRDNLYQAAAIDGVASIRPLYMGRTSWRNPENRATRQIFIYGIDPNRPPFELPEIERHSSELKLLNRALFDRAGLIPQLGDVPTLLQQENPLFVQVNDFQLGIVGLFRFGSSFSADGNLITSDSTFLKLFPQRQPNQIDLGIIELEPNTTIEEVQARLQTNLSSSILVLTKDEISARELAYWETSSSIGFTFNLGVAIGFFVGAVIVYQILFTSVNEHLSEYATLKAIGYSEAYLIGVVIQEALILAVLGFIPGFLLSTGLYTLLQSAILLPIGMKLTRAITVLFLTIIMCLGGGAFAVRKLSSADPADIF
ncbi:MAG: ABC transporter permease DevC [Cyanobacteria bacterium P01_A01_bin.40]